MGRCACALHCSSGAKRPSHCGKLSYTVSGTSTSGGLASPEQLDRDVIRPATLQSHRDQGLAHNCGRLALDGLKYFLIRHQSPQSVGAEDEGIALLHNKRLMREVDRDFTARAQSGRKNVTLRMGFSIFGAYDTTLDQPAYICVIAGEPRNLAGANQVEATVADMGKIKLPRNHRDRCAGCAHPLKCRMIFAVLLYALVRYSKGFHQSDVGIAIEGGAVNLEHGFDRDPTRLLTAFVPTHTVGNHREASLALELCVALTFPINVRVFVVLALAADISQACHFHARLHLHAINRHSKFRSIFKLRGEQISCKRLIIRQSMHFSFEPEVC